MKGTEDEVQLGETISVVQRVEENGKVCHTDVECTLTPETAVLLAEKGIIEIVEDEEDDDLQDYDEEDFPCEVAQMVDELIQLQDKLEHRLEMMEKNHKIICRSLAELNKKVEGILAASAPKKDNKKK